MDQPFDNPQDSPSLSPSTSSPPTSSSSSSSSSSSLEAPHRQLRHPLQKLQALTVAACAEVTDAGLLALLGLEKNPSAHRHQEPQLLWQLPCLSKLDVSGCPLVGSQLGVALAGHALVHYQLLGQSSGNISNISSSSSSSSSGASTSTTSLSSSSLPLGIRELDLRGCKAFTDAAAYATADALRFAPLSTLPAGRTTPAKNSTSTTAASNASANSATAGRWNAVQLPWRWLAVGAPGLASIGDSGLQRLASACSHSLVHLSVAAAEHVTGTGLGTALAPLLDPRKGGILRSLELHWCSLLRDQVIERATLPMCTPKSLFNQRFIFQRACW